MRGHAKADLPPIRPARSVGHIVLAQAKRLSGNRQVDINVVKALCADVLQSESSTRGPITTTTRLAKGAREYTEARNYRLSAASERMLSNGSRT